MGVVYANIKLFNPVAIDLEPIEVTSLVDSGSTYLCIPQQISNQ